MQQRNIYDCEDLVQYSAMAIETILGLDVFASPTP